MATMRSCASASWCTGGCISSIQAGNGSAPRSAMSLIEIIVMTARAFSSLSPPAPSGRQGDRSEAYRDHRQNAEQGPNHGTRLRADPTPFGIATSTITSLAEELFQDRRPRMARDPFMWKLWGHNPYLSCSRRSAVGLSPDFCRGEPTFGVLLDSGVPPLRQRCGMHAVATLLSVPQSVPTC